MSYPVLKQVSNKQGDYRIVLFTAYNEGVVVETNHDQSPVGTINWFKEDRYTEFHGTVRISNDIMEGVE